MVMAVGVPRCSWRRMMSLRAAAFALDRRFGRTRLPRLSLMEVGSRSLTSFEKALSLVEGLLEVVTRGRGSARPESMEYSSSILS